MARSGGERIVSTPDLDGSQGTLVASSMCSRTLLYVLQDDLADLLAVGTANGKANRPGKFLHPHGKLLMASGTSHLNALYFAFFIHTRTKINTKKE